ncbi:hypothetical protein HUG17_7981 [Dermatophagoides farinae]|uniref:Uncharacterized protein n=1 Tax=Dermatophagoides farinae TaxID=6954 RepID=A0A9D4NXA2_DERFA|nr:hypothetical protein HUG17_7981 [Dermatophagoides farinae]
MWLLPSSSSSTLNTSSLLTKLLFRNNSTSDWIFTSSSMADNNQTIDKQQRKHHQHQQQQLNSNNNNKGASSLKNSINTKNPNNKKRLHLLTEKDFLSTVFQHHQSSSNTSNSQFNNSNDNDSSINHRKQNHAIITNRVTGTMVINTDKQNGFNPFHITSDPWRRRKTYPTKPHEVILVISGCLFFISFFLGTFAQIKSEISLYNMIMRFIHWNQQWIIEEYDPSNDDSNGIGTTSVAASTAAGTMNQSPVHTLLMIETQINNGNNNDGQIISAINERTNSIDKSVIVNM